MPRETTSRGLCGLVCASRTSERGGEGDCVKEGGFIISATSSATVPNLGLGIRPRGPRICATCDANFMHLLRAGGEEKKTKGPKVSVRA